MILYQSLIDRLKNQHEAIAYIIANTGNTRLNYHSSPTKWSIRDNIAHLAKYQLVFIERINNILKNETPVFERYTAEEDPEFENWRMLEITDLNKSLKKERKFIYKLITNLSDQELKRSGFHKKFGKMAIIQWTEFFLLHEAHHIFTIFQIAHDPE